MRYLLLIIAIFFVILFQANTYAQKAPIVNITCNNSEEVNESKIYNLEFNNISYALDRNSNEKSSVKFNGEQSFIKVNKNINSTNLPKLTILFWAKPDSDSKRMTVFSHDDGGFDRSMAIDSRAGSGWKWTAYCAKPMGSGRVKSDKWTFVAVTFDHSKNEILMCVDGKFYKDNGRAGNGLNFFHFGNNPSFGEPYYGLLDDIRIYDNALSEEELLAIFKSDGGVIDNSEQYFYSEQSENADVVVRVGDVDNLGFGWPKGFDPFCGKNTLVHAFPWKVDLNDHPGTDRIMAVSSYKTGRRDGYVSSTKRPANNPIDIVMQYPAPTVKIERVVLQMMLDDFQAPVWGTSFQFHLNGKRLSYIEEIINNLRQTGPIGKLTQVGFLPKDNKLFEAGNVRIKIDDPITGAGDGFAIDFVQLLINPKGEYRCIGNITGNVKDEKGKVLENVLVSANGLKESLTSNDGNFTLSSVPVGIIVVSANKETYSTASVNFELQREENKLIELVLKKKAKESENYLSKELKEKGYINLYGIYFDSNKDVPKSESQSTLTELANFLKNNTDIKIEIIGHTDSDGNEKHNLDLSKRRAQSIISWLKENGVNMANIKAKGLGESSPVANNKTESGKALNRRVELRIIE
jgi:OmpA-OmpF porin, OOP family